MFYYFRVQFRCSVHLDLVVLLLSVYSEPRARYSRTRHDDSVYAKATLHVPPLSSVSTPSTLRSAWSARYLEVSNE